MKRLAKVAVKFLTAVVLSMMKHLAKLAVEFLTAAVPPGVVLGGIIGILVLLCDFDLEAICGSAGIIGPFLGGNVALWLYGTKCRIISVQ